MSIPYLAMRNDVQPKLLSIGMCAVLIACGGGVQPQKSVYDLYELHPVGAPVDNDSYYVPPKKFSGCGTIGDAPSCTSF